MQINDFRIVLNTGNTVEESSNYLADVKHAMCCAIMQQVETDTVNANFKHYQTIYLEAHHIQTNLK